MKLLSVSFKKLKVYEGIYTSPLDQALPSEKMLATFEHNEVIDSTLPASNDCKENMSKTEKRSAQTSRNPEHVRSIQSVNEHNREIPGMAQPIQAKETQRAMSLHDGQGEGVHVPEHATLNNDRIIKELERLEMQVAAKVKVPSVREAVTAKIREATRTMSGVKKRAVLKKGRKTANKSDLDVDNIVGSKRRRLRDQSPVQRK